MLIYQPAFHKPFLPFRIDVAAIQNRGTPTESARGAGIASPGTLNRCTSVLHYGTPKPPSHVCIFDTTLRDGLLLNPGALSRSQKLAIAEQLASLRVDVIEAGLPTLSPENFATTQQIASTVGNRHNPPTICALSRASEKDIQKCYDAIHEARLPRIHVYLPTPLSGDLTDRSKDQLLVKTKDAITFARSLCADVEFSPMNATSLFTTNLPFLHDVYTQAIKAGASTVSVPDSLGKATSTLYADLIPSLCTNVAGIDNVTISVHAHGDKETAVRNSVEAVKAGVRQIECTVLGIGEGMAPLERVVHELRALERRGDHELMLGTQIRDEEIDFTCQMVREFMKMDRDRS